MLKLRNSTNWKTQNHLKQINYENVVAIRERMIECLWKNEINYIYEHNYGCELN